MKKVLLGMLFILIGFMGYQIIFNNDYNEYENSTRQSHNYFLEVNSLTIHYNNYSSRQDLNSKEEVSKIVNILNKSKRVPSNIEYKLSDEVTLEIALSYENNSKEVLSFFRKFEEGKVLISSDKNIYYTLDKIEYNKYFIISKLINKEIVS
jgi:hypothetical protein